MKKYLSIAVIIIIIIIGWVVVKKDTVPVAGEAIKVGAILPLSGFAANYGDESKNGITLAQEDLKDKYPGLNLEVLYEDSMYTPKGGLDAYTKLKSINNVKAVLVGAGQIATPIKEQAEKDGVLEMAIWSSNPSYSQGTHNLNFRSTLLATDLVPPLVGYMNEKKLTKLATLYAQNEFGQSYDAAFAEIDAEDSNWQLVSREGFLNDESDFKTQLTKIKAAKADTVFYVGTVKQFATVLTQAKDLDVKAQFIGMSTAEDQLLLTEAKQAAEGLVYSYIFDYEGSEAKKFTDEYQERFGRIPTFYAAESYVGMQLVGEAISACGSDVTAQCWKGKLDALKDFSTIMGKVTMASNGDLKGPAVFLKTVKNGQFVKLAE